MKKLLIVLFCIVILYACGIKKADEAVVNEELAEGNPGAAGTKILVTVKKLAYEKFEHFFIANGSVEAVQDAFISPEINGQIKKIHVKEGQRVREGELLVSLNADVIKNSIAEVETGLELARTIYKKRKGLWDKKIGSEVQYLEAKSNKESLENKLKTFNAQLEMTRIKAPISGIVDEILNKEGEFAVPGLQLIQLVNLNKVYVNAEISEAYLPIIHKRDAVQVNFPSYPNLTIDTFVHRTGNIVKIQNRTFLVQVLIDNKDEKLKPNILAIIKMRDFSAEAALVVPSIIIKNDLQGTYLYVAKTEDGKLIARKTYIKPGKSKASNTMVVEGLEPGLQVIVEGYNLVKNGMAIRIKS